MTLVEAARSLPKEKNQEPPKNYTGWIVAELHDPFVGHAPGRRMQEGRPWGRFVVGSVNAPSDSPRTFGSLPLSSIKRWAALCREDALQIIRETTAPVFGVD
jgi:hypothetical protein